ncbi:transcription factor E2F6 isoform X2 [Corythoichthys intestinalis]|uniref:transcription factor E2F6 isoform X2 n=1 Tax=Corythoichthys intestinalis TaxID=161448 RepID=UPI0025A56F21|nr:transcription factor E2F6 isoform X2 [Corythoichthys intestinalis]XP_061806311.1 transcription factor E2F6-like [Nerophis lumbriciformis]
MVKCVVSGCPNRLLNGNRGVLSRAPKRFFPFPKDPARVKVWLAALRETDKKWEVAEQRFICEEHFLPEDVTADGVNGDAIPIMPPYLDGPLGETGAWGAESEEEEDDQWGGGGGSGMEEEEEEADEDESGASLQQVKPSSEHLQPKEDPPTPKTCRNDVLLAPLTRRLLELMLASPESWLDLHQAAGRLQTRKRHVYDIIGVLESISVVQRRSRSVKWTGRCPVSRFLWKTEEKFKEELENLKLEENTLDGLIKKCAQQLFDMTDNEENATAAYVTHEDVGRLPAFQEQTVIVVKAPEETKLEVPAPTQDNIKMHLRGGKGPIAVMTCDLGTGGVPVKEEMSGCFMTLDQSRIQTQTLLKTAH